MAWVFLVALVVCWVGFYFVMWLVDRRTWRRIRQLPPPPDIADLTWKPVGGKAEHVTLYDVRTQEAVATLDVPIPVASHPLPYDWEVTGDFD